MSCNCDPCKNPKVTIGCDGEFEINGLDCTYEDMPDAYSVDADGFGVVEGCNTRFEIDCGNQFGLCLTNCDRDARLKSHISGTYILTKQSKDSPYHNNSPSIIATYVYLTYFSNQYRFGCYLDPSSINVVATELILKMYKPAYPCSYAAELTIVFPGHGLPCDTAGVLTGGLYEWGNQVDYMCFSKPLCGGAYSFERFFTRPTPGAGGACLISPTSLNAIPVVPTP